MRRNLTAWQMLCLYGWNNVKAREPADVFTVQGSSLNGFYLQPPGCGHADL